MMVFVRSISKGIKRPDEVVLTMILKKLGVDAAILNTVIIPRTIPLRMFVTILDSIPNLRVLETKLEYRTFYHEIPRNKVPYQSLLTTHRPLKLERLELSFSCEDIIRGVFRVIERCSATLTSLGITANNEQRVDFTQVLSNGIEFGQDYQAPRFDFSRLEKLRIAMDKKSNLGHCLLRLSTGTFKRLSSLLVHLGVDVHGFVQTLLANGAPLRSVQILGDQGSIDWTNPDTRMEGNQVLKKLGPLHTLQLSDLGDWDMTTVSLHGRSLKRLWLSCHQAHPELPVPGQICPIARRLFEGDGDNVRSLITIEGWPVLEEIALPFFGVEKLPLHPGIRVLRLEHLHNNELFESGTYATILGPYLTSLAAHVYPRRPSLQLIVIMPNVYDERYVGKAPDIKYLYVEYVRTAAAEGYEGRAFETGPNIIHVLQRYKWSYLIQENTLGRMWDDTARRLLTEPERIDFYRFKY
ncbi:hypothetical protein TWF481_002120 [Arthrobotrys musiformis]|uniref:F-box domain-containing protein n=1 Tax=Arthrobotrys musiformis TaxID=47236 RepID=A0AAV9VSA4_9PEZI